MAYLIVLLLAAGPWDTGVQDDYLKEKKDLVIFVGTPIRPELKMPWYVAVRDDKLYEKKGIYVRAAGQWWYLPANVSKADWDHAFNRPEFWVPSGTNLAPRAEILRAPQNC